MMSGRSQPISKAGGIKCSNALHTHMVCRQVVLNKVKPDVALDEQMCSFFPHCGCVAVC